MNNEEARELLDEFAQAAMRAAITATWAEAFLLEGGEATWDAVKSVSSSADTLGALAGKVEGLVNHYKEITP